MAGLAQALTAADSRLLSLSRVFGPFASGFGNHC